MFVRLSESTILCFIVVINLMFVFSLLSLGGHYASRNFIIFTRSKTFLYMKLPDNCRRERPLVCTYLETLSICQTNGQTCLGLLRLNMLQGLGYYFSFSQSIIIKISEVENY